MIGFGERLKAARKEKNLTLEQLGSALGSSKAYAWQLENKQEATPSGDLLMKLCAALDKTPSYFLDSEASGGDDLAEQEILFRKFKTLSDRDKNTIRTLLNTLNDSKYKP